MSSWLLMLYVFTLSPRFANNFLSSLLCGLYTVLIFVPDCHVCSVFLVASISHPGGFCPCNDQKKCIKVLVEDIDGSYDDACSRFGGRAWIANGEVLARRLDLFFLLMDQEWPTCEDCGKAMVHYGQYNIDELGQNTDIHPFTQGILQVRKNSLLAFFHRFLRSSSKDLHLPHLGSRLVRQCWSGPWKNIWSRALDQYHWEISRWRRRRGRSRWKIDGWSQQGPSSPLFLWTLSVFFIIELAGFSTWCCCFQNQDEARFQQIPSCKR